MLWMLRGLAIYSSDNLPEVVVLFEVVYIPMCYYYQYILVILVVTEEGTNVVCVPEL